MQLLMSYSRPTAVGPANEEIHFNSSGEVKVKFHWDRRADRNVTVRRTTSPTRLHLG